MNLTIAELAEMPLPAAVFDAENELIARTPEWNGSIPGSVSYPVRNTRLVVATGGTNPKCELVLSRLLDAMDETARSLSGNQMMRVAMLAASLRIMAGREISGRGTSHDVIDYARAGITARTSLDVQVEGMPSFPVDSPEVAALVLVQFAANAERHARVTSVTISQTENSFHVVWPGLSGKRDIITARQRSDRERWGMAFARIAADTLGGAVYPPYDRGDGMVVATLELGLNRLALPLAAIRGGKVQKSTRSFDEESGVVAGSAVPSGSKLWSTMQNALAAPDQITVTEGWWARNTRDVVWVAIPPDDILDRARDVLDGIVHERALWDGVPEPGQSKVFALASLLASLLGTALPRVPSETWNRKMQELAPAFGLEMEIPRFDGIGAVDARVAAFLAAEFGDYFEVDGEELFLYPRRDKMDSPFTRIFLPRDEDALRLS